MAYELTQRVSESATFLEDPFTGPPRSAYRMESPLRPFVGATVLDAYGQWHPTTLAPVLFRGTACDDPVESVGFRGVLLFRRPETIQTTRMRGWDVVANWRGREGGGRMAWSSDFRIALPWSVRARRALAQLPARLVERVRELRRVGLGNALARAFGRPSAVEEEW